MAADTDDIVVINTHEIGRVGSSSLVMRTTTTTRAVADRAASLIAPSGSIPSTATKTTSRQHTSVTVTSEPITFILDPGVMARRVAEVFARRIREQTEQIVEPVERSTAKARRKMERAFYRAKPYAWTRYDGGRTGVTPPRTGEIRKYNHSGRLARSIVAAYVHSQKHWKINFAANRWNPTHWSSLGAMQRAFQGWVARVPVLQNPSADVPIVKAFKDTWKDVVSKAQMGADHKFAMHKGKARLDALRLLQGGTSSQERDDEEDEAVSA